MVCLVPFINFRITALINDFCILQIPVKNIVTEREMFCLTSFSFNQVKSKNNYLLHQSYPKML